MSDYKKIIEIPKSNVSNHQKTSNLYYVSKTTKPLSSKSKLAIFEFDDQASFESFTKKKELLDTEEIQEEVIDKPSNKSCRERYFSMIQPCSVRASILTIISSMIGVGFLTLPAIGRENGYVPCFLFITLSAFLSLFGNLQ